MSVFMSMLGTRMQTCDPVSVGLATSISIENEKSEVALGPHRLACNGGQHLATEAITKVVHGFSCPRQEYVLTPVKRQLWFQAHIHNLSSAPESHT